MVGDLKGRRAIAAGQEQKNLKGSNCYMGERLEDGMGLGSKQQTGKKDLLGLSSFVVMGQNVDHVF